VVFEHEVIYCAAEEDAAVGWVEAIQLKVGLYVFLVCLA
jgi:hypothetical protein